MCVVFEKEPLCKPLLKDITPVILGLRGDAGVDDLPVRLWEGYFELVININIHYYYTCIFLSPLSLPGLAVSRSGTDCRLSPCVDDGLLYLEVLWNTPLHSWTGVASEASVTCSTKNISENPSLGCAIIIITCAASVRHLRLWDVADEPSVCVVEVESSESPSEGDSDDHGVINDEPFIAVGGWRRERAVCVRARRWL